jgi:hypothetical protein
MPLFLDSHILPDGATAEDVAEFHAKDLAIQASFGVQMVKYWYDASRGRVFCLVVAPSREAAVAVHRAASGHEPDDIFEVQEFE